MIHCNLFFDCLETISICFAQDLEFLVMDDTYRYSIYSTGTSVGYQLMRAYVFLFSTGTVPGVTDKNMNLLASYRYRYLPNCFVNIDSAT
jgi:hypothetical protein